MDPLAEKFSFQSSFAYAANNPIKFIDKNGKNPALPVIIVGGVVITVADAFLLTAGLVTSGLIIHKARDGSFAINSSIKDYFHRDNPGYKEQQKRERASQNETSNILQKHAKTVEQNIGKPTPDGDNEPKGGGSKFGKVIVGAGLAAEFTKGWIETTRGNNQNSTGDNSSDNQAKSSAATAGGQGGKSSQSTSESGSSATFTMPIIYPLPADDKKVKAPIIPLRLNE